MKHCFIFFHLIAPLFLFSQSGVVVSIKDGDTMVILDSLKVQHTIRVADIDCPEKGQPFSEKAKDFVSDQVFGKFVTIKPKSIDHYGRVIGFVLYDDKNLSLELLKHGFAWHYSYYSNDQEMAELEIYARNNKIGLWIDPNPINPYKWRRGERN
tara:strand:- start:981 stop:1442 length:462 start_codon:yes stop_codon:yes gene_type:complete